MGKVDEEGALRLFVKACDLECEVGCASAARLGRSWSGERFSAEKSKKYYRRACDLGSKVSCEQVHRIENAELFLPLLYGGVGTAIVLALAFFVVGKLKKRIQSRTRRVKRTITVVAVVTMCVAQLIVFLCGVVSFEMAVRTIAVGIAVGLFFFFVAGRDARTTTVHGDVQY